MLNEISKRLAKKLVECSGEDKEEIYVYGLEIIITTFCGLLSILFISSIFTALVCGLTFILIFVPLRLFVGGYHAETYGKCFVITNLTYWMVLFIHDLLWNRVATEVWILLFLVASIYIICNAPMINPAQPINQYKQIRSKKITKIIIIIDFLLLICLAREYKEMLSMAVLSVCLVAAFMLYANIVTNKRVEVLE